ncbi:MAG: hypothetical protein IKN79_03690, partial [Eubacterium sp.]|nr:hypothetical protein [Eubacterium sp.]
MEILGQLKNVLRFMNYKDLVNSLSSKEPSELEEWAENTENRIMLQLILPDGNAPSIERLNEVTDSGIGKGQVNET